MPIEAIDVPSFVYGIAVGAVLSVLLLIVNIVSDAILTHKQMKREIRKAHDQGYADGRRWRGYEKAWLESNFERIREDVERIEKHYGDSTK